MAKAAAGGPPPPLGDDDDDCNDPPWPKAKDGGAFGVLLPVVVKDDRTVGPDESKGSSNESSAMVVACLLACECEARRGEARQGVVLRC